MVKRTIEDYIKILKRGENVVFSDILISGLKGSRVYLDDLRPGADDTDLYDSMRGRE